MISFSQKGEFVMPTTRMKFATEGLPVPVVFGILMALGNIVWKPGEREICGEVEQGLGVVFFS